MKALDTGLLLGLLEGSAKARELVRRLRGVELATTEANLLELAYFVPSVSRRSRSAGLAALERLRQRLTVLPLDGRSISTASQRIHGHAEKVAPTVAAMMGALAAAGCEELLTDDPRSIVGDWGVRVKVVPI